MIDFVEYVVAELSSRRLSKTDALALVKQFELGKKPAAQRAVIHQLLHENTSDLEQQSYVTRLSGDELFLRDHRVEGRRVLPGVAYLEMARVAVETAAPGACGSGAIELRNVIWAQPIIVAEPREVSIALFPQDGQAGRHDIDYEIHTLATEGEGSYRQTVHSRGLASIVARPAPVRLNLEQLQAQMTSGVLQAPDIYAAYEKMGISYGPTHQALTCISQGDGQLLARLSLPSESSPSQDYLLHPSMMDAAIQAAVGFAGSLAQMPDRPALPFALESLRILGPCTQEMFAWLRYSAGSGPSDRIIRVDIDLCDTEGNVCVQLEGFASRVLRDNTEQTGTLLAVPRWEAEPQTGKTAAGSQTAADTRLAHRHIVLCGLPAINPAEIESLIGTGSLTCVSWPGKAKQDLAQRYCEVACDCFELVKTALESKPRGRTLIQLVIADDADAALLQGISGLFKTATIENPALTGQIIITANAGDSNALVEQLQAESNERRSGIVRHARGVREVLKWRELAVRDATVTQTAFKHNGVYLITGGLGGLGVLMAKEIIQHSQDVRIVLTGRSMLTPEKQAILETLSAPRCSVEYRQMDLADANDVQRVIDAVIADDQQLSGIIHCAGMISDSFILNKTSAEFLRVLEPKVVGTFNLDRATRAIPLDFMVLFSGGAAVTGNAGQADYAAANGFMDQFAGYRNARVSAGQRHGRTLAINWPLWQEGGMRVDATTIESLETSTGLHPMRTATGMHAFHRSLTLPEAQIQVVEGDLPKLRQLLLGTSADTHAHAMPVQQPAAGTPDINAVRQKSQDFLKRVLARVLKLNIEQIDAAAPFEKYGIDSILMMKLTEELERTFGSLPKTLFFEYQSLSELAGYFVTNHAQRIAGLIGSLTIPVSRSSPAGATPKPTSESRPAPRPKERATSRLHRRRSPAAVPEASIRAVPRVNEPIAIIGLSGRYPEAVDVEQYWRNLRDGKDCIVEVPKDRWDWREYFTEDRNQPGRHYSKWGGFICGVDEFDPLFFNISPREASAIDPQERLFLQHAWMAVEDAGLTRASLQVAHGRDIPGQVGVYAGVMYSEYNLSGSIASVANRVSYVLNLHGPSMTVDTMCSSSLTAIHVACQDLRQGRTDLAIAGGVNVSIHPSKYLLLSAGQFISSDGHCQSFGAGGDGYIPGEGVGVVVLKRLSEAEQDGDHIYAIIRGSALNHGGKTNGYTVPNPQAQASVISHALTESNTDPRHVSYLEAHGTGTRLGDPIEIAALAKAFYGQSAQKEFGFCAIGSAKSNIGHCESAAGIAGLTKVLLQMQHRQIVPSLHSQTLNPNIDFDKSPFVVNQTLRSWDRPIIEGRQVPRIAGLSSFGAGGSNAHLIVEEYVAPEETGASRTAPPATARPATQLPVIIPLSARTTVQLQQRARDLLRFIRALPVLEALDLNALAYTLQTGREAMAKRLGLVVDSAEQLAAKLQAYLDGEEDIEGVLQGQAPESQDTQTLSLFAEDADLKETIDKWIARRNLSRLLELWVKGLELSWHKLYGAAKPRRMSLPAYPFAREKYWVETVGQVVPGAVGSKKAQALHPLVHTNTSDLFQQSYVSEFSGNESFLADHRIGSDPARLSKILPGAAYLEMIRAAVDLALPVRSGGQPLEIRNVAWAQPLVADDRKLVSVALTSAGETVVDFSVRADDSAQQEAVVHCQGQVEVLSTPSTDRLDLNALRARMTAGVLTASTVYERFQAVGIHYGPAFQCVASIHRGSGEVLGQLALPASRAIESNYVLDPSLLDGALQCSIGLIADLDGRPSGEPFIPFALDSIVVAAPCVPNMFVWARYAEGGQDLGQGATGPRKIDIDLCDGDGNICARLKGLTSRSISTAAATESVSLLLAYPEWKSVPRADAVPVTGRATYRHHVLLCGLPQLDADQLQAAVPGTQVKRLAYPDVGSADLANRYQSAALACFEALQSILRSPSQQQTVFQLVIGGEDDAALLAGLSGLIETARRENPQLIGQVILTERALGVAALATQLRSALTQSGECLFKQVGDTQSVLSWQPEELHESARMAFKDGGVYLITGGMGGLGLIFATEILERTADSTVILTGRSEKLDAAQAAVLENLTARLSVARSRIAYRQLDLTRLDDVTRLVAQIITEFGDLNGVIHSAGMTQDRFIIQKTPVEFAEVLQPKVTGTVNLDLATKQANLDFLVLFSSVSSAMGNAGQADYAAANGFMDQFAAYRNGQVSQGERHGRTIAINWPLWQDGGMRLDVPAIKLLEQVSGMVPLKTANGLQAFYRILESQSDRAAQALVIEGYPGRLRRSLQSRHPTLIIEPAADTREAPGLLLEAAQRYLSAQLATLLKVPPHEVDPRAPLEKYGMDSVMAMQLTSELERTFGSLSKTLFFEYQSIAALAAYLVKAFPQVILEKTGVAAVTARAQQPVSKPVVASLPPIRKVRLPQPSISTGDEVAIVGLAGRYPAAKNLREFWENLRNGRDCITEIPADRWDHAAFYDPARNRPGKTYSKWGGFVPEADRFDALFFNLSPREAELIDPQERLFLETVWETIEDAGYSKEAISRNRVGVYVGVMWGQYELYGADSAAAGVPSSSFASIANRVSYFFDLHGPSLALDTMCSSSLTAIHLASEEVRRGNVDVAIAGGVNLSVHPNKYLILSQGNFTSSDGRCRSFGAGGDGYVPGEGVGAILLKPLQKALRDGDHIYGLVKASSINHGGKTNGYTVPNPTAQSDLIIDVLEKARVDFTTIGYVESHGTGTSLGDPIEVTALARAFHGASRQGRPPAGQSCSLGSVKSNIGHLESAAGIAALTKVLLQLKHRQLVPSLHSERLNPHIDFANTPFRVQRSLEEWQSGDGYPRRAAVSSFGAGGSNAHLIVEEFPDTRAAPAQERPEAFVLSAKNRAALIAYAQRMHDFLDGEPGLSLADIAYTSQVGRTAMQERLALIASSKPALREKLRQWVLDAKASGPQSQRSVGLAIEGVFEGSTRDAPAIAAAVMGGDSGRSFLDQTVENRDLETIAKLWVYGVELEWAKLHRAENPQRVSLPTYPFARDRHWIHTPAQFAALPPPAATSQPEAPKGSLYYRVNWQPTPLIAATASPQEVPGPMLVIGADDELLAELRHRSPSLTILTLKAGEEYQQSADGSIPRTVIHYVQDAHTLAEQLDRGVFSLHALCKSIMECKPKESVRIVSCRRSGAAVSATLHEATAGYLKTLALENPKFSWKVISTDEQSTVDELAQQLWDEVADLSWRDAEVRYVRDPRGEGQVSCRQVKELIRHAPSLETRKQPHPIKQNGVYIVTGGLGGLGYLFSEHLARQYGAKLVLTGRSALNSEQRSKLSALQSYSPDVVYVQADVSDPEQAETVIREARLRFPRISGVIHAAGVHHDAFLINKAREDIDLVLTAKIQGTINLDRATQDDELDLFILFSSVAGAFGNVGQGDYAYANAFMDAFAQQRQAQVSARQRCGRTLSINWPFWSEGGMKLSPSDLERTEALTGLSALPTEEGLRCWEELLQTDLRQAVVLYGSPSRLEAYVAAASLRKQGSRHTAPSQLPAAGPPASSSQPALLAETETYLKRLIGAEIKLPPERIDSEERFESFGIDSILVGRLNATLARDLGELPKTLFYEYESIAELAKYLSQEATSALVQLLEPGSAEAEQVVPAAGVGSTPAGVGPATGPAPSAPIPDRTLQSAEPIAIIGVHGLYPQSKDLEEFWTHLRQGKDLVEVVPPTRWDAQDLYDADPNKATAGKIYCKWGAFLEDFDKFDAGFFNVAPDEARLMDPQERLFLGSVWAAFEDAGYTRDSLKRHFPKGKSADVGVFVGVTSNTYHLLTTDEWQRGNMTSPSALPWSIANRVSYFFNFQGPSLPIDTACSSSLVAIHMACESLRQGECQVAVAGGVNLYLHPAKYLSFCQNRMLSVSGRCRSFGAGDDGFVPGEGVGTLILKPLRKALEQRDQIYAVIAASAFDHSGRSSGYSAPNPNSQASLISRTLAKAGIDPQTIGYIEGHGTGTQLGDSLEITALTQAFRRKTTKQGFCPVGSVKANLGHSESAAGITGVTKILLQMKHQQLAPTIHSDEVNPNLVLKGSPFYLQHGLTPWTASPLHPRRALINSFGAGGVNACVVLEESPALQVGTDAAGRDALGPHLIVLSAKTQDRLREYTQKLIAYVRKAQAQNTRGLDLGSIAYTLQVGREAMPERLAVVVTDVEDLTEKLESWCRGNSSAQVHRGSLDPRRGVAKSRNPGEMAALLEARDLAGVARAWTAGAEVDWEEVQARGTASRISLPTYPFAKERYWISDAPASTHRERGAEGAARLHPLVSYNSSTFNQVSFSCLLSSNEFYAQDHKVNGQMIFPGAGYLEIACVAGNLASAKKVRKIQDVVWIQPLVFGNQPPRVEICLKPGDDNAEYIITSCGENGEKVVHSEGILYFQHRATSHDAVAEILPIETLKKRCSKPLEGGQLYDLFQKTGISYGPAFRTVQELYLGDAAALCKLRIAEHLRAGFDEFILHPSILDGALQAVAGLLGGAEPVPHLPFAIGEVEILRRTSPGCYVHVERAPHEQSSGEVRKFNIKITNEKGLVVIALKDFCVRAFKHRTTTPSPVNNLAPRRS